MSAKTHDARLARRTVTAVAAGLICTVGVASLGETRQAESDPIVIGHGPKAVYVGLAPTLGGDPAHGEPEESYFARTSRHLRACRPPLPSMDRGGTAQRPSPGPTRHREKRTTPTSPAPAATCQHPEHPRGRGRAHRTSLHADRAHQTRSDLDRARRSEKSNQGLEETVHLAHATCRDNVVRAIADAAVVRARTTSVVDPDAHVLGVRHRLAADHRTQGIRRRTRRRVSASGGRPRAGGERRVRAHRGRPRTSCAPAPRAASTIARTTASWHGHGPSALPGRGLGWTSLNVVLVHSVGSCLVGLDRRVARCGEHGHAYGRSGCWQVAAGAGEVGVVGFPRCRISTR